MAEHQLTLNRRKAVARILTDRGDALLITGLGSSTWDVAAAGDHPNNFYLWGAMGGAAVMGLGLALAQPNRRVLVITGDGEFVLGLGALATIAVAAPGNLAVCVIDNERYGETGMQEGHTAAGVDLVAMAAAAGSYFSTMPGPPPYGRSSTVRCASTVKSRGFWQSRETSSRSTALPTTPYSAIVATISGKIVTTCKSIASVPFPIDADLTFGKINIQNYFAHHKRDQAFAIPIHNQHIVRACRHQIGHSSQRPPVAMDNLQSFQVRPVILTGLCLRQIFARHCDFDIE